MLNVFSKRPGLTQEGALEMSILLIKHLEAVGSISFYETERSCGCANSHNDVPRESWRCYSEADLSAVISFQHTSVAAVQQV